MAIRIGSKVMVSYPDGDRGNNPARKYEGQTFTVDGIKRYPHYAGNNRAMYTLHGAESEYGTPYWFLDDELVVIDNV